jgi:hypothetical protein
MSMAMTIDEKGPSLQIIYDSKIKLMIEISAGKWERGDVECWVSPKG